MRYELTAGASSKFWDIVLDARTFAVTWGRIGTTGQTQSKTFKTPAEARAAHDKLVAEKRKKGYEPAGPIKTSSPPGIADTAARIEAFSRKIASLPGLDVHPFALRPSSAAALASLERSLHVSLPKDVKEFLQRGLESVQGSTPEPFASIGFEFLDAKRITSHTQMLRKLVARNDPDDEHSQIVGRGVALTYGEPELVLSGGALYHFSLRNPLLRVASTFTEFLDHYLAAGCFCSHDFRALWKIVARHVPAAIPPAKNVWISAYKKQFPSYWRS